MFVLVEKPFKHSIVQHFEGGSVWWVSLEAMQCVFTLFLRTEIIFATQSNLYKLLNASATDGCCQPHSWAELFSVQFKTYLLSGIKIRVQLQDVTAAFIRYTLGV